MLKMKQIKKLGHDLSSFNIIQIFKTITINLIISICNPNPKDTKIFIVPKNFKEKVLFIKQLCNFLNL